ncbi:phospholipid carrier-dependent glycosyltransferase [Candidatus Woesearchaeota archaeon]|nr:phospholipid carrier-dependent glycosyltransferase [Candidatus Woesearchaeota archaeon]
MNITTIILFFVYLWGLGFTATLFIKKWGNFWERNLMRMGIGLPVFVVLGTVLNLAHIPLDWRIFLVVSLAVPVYCLGRYFIKNKFNFEDDLNEISKINKIKLDKADLYLLGVFVLFAFTFYMYHTGAFSYPYLEDDDPWEHARSVRYIALEKTAYEPYTGKDLFRYIDPYPPAYDILMAVLYQTNDSVNWTLKFFNALIISLSIIVFYFFATKFMKSRKKALLATFILTVIPSYLSHFIWAHSLLPFLVCVAFYCLECINSEGSSGGGNEEMEECKKEARKWMFVSALAIAGIFLVHPEHAIKFLLFFGVYVVIKWIFERKWPLEHFYSLLIGIALSLSWWAMKIGSFFTERAGRISDLDPGLVSRDTSLVYKIVSFVQNYFKPNLGSATKAYTFDDFFVAKSGNMINNPIGWGIIITILIIISVFMVVMLAKKYYKNKSYYPVVILGWLLIAFLIVNSATFNIPGLFGFRTWLLLAIPTALICAEGFFVILKLVPDKIKVVRVVLVMVLLIGLWYTSGEQKYAVNTAMWPPGASWTSMEEVQLYLWLNSLPKNTKVMSFSGSQNNEVIGLDMDNCDWCEQNIKLREGFINKSSLDVYNFLKKEKYEYFILDSMSFRYYDFGNKTQEIIIGKFQDYFNSKDKFVVVYQNNGGVIVKVV